MRPTLPGSVRHFFFLRGLPPSLPFSRTAAALAGLVRLPPFAPSFLYHSLTAFGTFMASLTKNALVSVCKNNRLTTNRVARLVHGYYCANLSSIAYSLHALPMGARSAQTGRGTPP